MTRGLRHLLLLAAPLIALGCASGAQDPSDPPPLLEQLPRALSGGESQVVTAGNQLAFDLLRTAQVTAADSNIFLSPTSAAMALAMTLNGAAGSTFDSMRVALRLGGLSQEEINAGYRSLIDLLRGLDPHVEFALANSIWANATTAFAPAFLETARTAFDAEVRSLDFGAASTLAAINDWVKDKTRGKIPKLLDQIAREEVMFLVNAIYFQGDWRRSFDPAKTQPLPFQAPSGPTTVATMRLEPNLLLTGHQDGHLLVELLYGNGAFAMTLVLPREGSTVRELVAGLDAARWAEWTGALAESRVGLLLPKFRLEYLRQLTGDLSGLGMGIAFDPERADFSRMRGPGTPGLYLTRVVQRTFVDVDEKGTTAAAATAVGVGVTSLPATIAFDRPFLFAIRERLSGTILFVGQVVRPGSSE